MRDYTEQNINELKFKAKNKELYLAKKTSGLNLVITGVVLFVLGILSDVLCFLPMLGDEDGSNLGIMIFLIVIGVVLILVSFIPMGIGLPKLIQGSIQYTKAMNAEKYLQDINE